MDICKTQLQPNQVKKSGLQAGHQVEGWKSWKSIQTKKKAGITGCPAPQWAACLAVFQFVKYISEIAHFLSPVEF